MQTFSVDLLGPRGPQVLRVKHGDSMSRFFRLIVTDNSAAWEPPEGVLFTVRFATKDSTGWYDTIQLPGGGSRPAVKADGNTLTVEVAMQATSSDGALCVVANAPTGYQLAAWNIQLRSEVVPGADSPEAEDYYGVLAEQIAQVAQDASAAAASAAAAEKSAEDAKQSALAAKGHTIQDGDGVAMEQRAALQFVGFNVADDPSGKTIVSPQIAGDTKNVAGYVGEVVVFADSILRENFVWADGGTIDPAQWPDLAAHAAEAGWQTDEGSGWYKTPDLRGRFMLTQSDSHAVGSTGGEEEHTLTVPEIPRHSHGVTQGYVQEGGTGGFAKSDYTGTSGTIEYTGGGQAHNNMPPYYVVTAQIRAKVDEITAKVVEVNGDTLAGFEDGQVLVQQDGKMTGVSGMLPYKTGDTITLGRCCVAAFASGGGEDLIFTVPLDRPVIATGATFSGQINVRGSTGQYAVQSYQYSTAQTLSVSNAGITFTGTPSWTNQPTNNTVLSVDILSATITFS